MQGKDSKCNSMNSSKETSIQLKPHALASTNGPDITDMIEKSGCSVPYYELENCLGEKDRDFRKCQDVVLNLRKCYANKPQR